jgi:DNA-binding IclR family transcriptional regulator
MTRNRLQTVERALDVLAVFSSDPRRDWTLTELAAHMGVHKTSVLRVLATLTDYGYLARDPKSRRYVLGPMILALAGAANALLSDLVRPTLTRLTNRTGETSLIHVLSGFQIVCVEKVDSSQPVRVTYDIGRRGPLHAGASGKAILANFSHEQFQRFISETELTRYTDTTVTDPSTLREQCQDIREQGYAVSTGELDLEVCAVAVPVRTLPGRSEGSISIVFPRQRWSPEVEAEYVSAAVEAVSEIGKGLGVPGSSLDGGAPAIWATRH